MTKDNQILKLYDEEKKEFNVIKLESVGECLLVVHQITDISSKCLMTWTVGRYEQKVALSSKRDVSFLSHNCKDEALRWLKTEMSMFVLTATDLDFRAWVVSGEEVTHCEFFLELYYKS